MAESQFAAQQGAAISGNIVLKRRLLVVTMQHHVTARNPEKNWQTNGDVHPTVRIQGVDYVSSSEMLEELSISRQTLWRWRTEGKIPAGHKFRDGRVLFTLGEADAIRRFANRIQPLEGIDTKQPDLFQQGK